MKFLPINRHRLGKNWDAWCHKHGIKKTPQTPLIPRLYNVEENEIYHWRRFLRIYLIATRGTVCENCGSKDNWLLHGLHVHEGIVKRNEKSKSVPRWWEIFAEYNCFILCGWCNTSRGLPRKKYYGKAVERYGKAKVDEWLESLPFKHVYRGEG